MGRHLPLLPPRLEAGGEGTGSASPPSAPLEPAPRLALFDLDDTLCDYATARDARLRRAFLGDGMEDGTRARLDAMVADSIARNPHGSDHFPELFRRHGIADSGRARKAMAWFRQNRFHGLGLHPDARPTLAAVRSYRGPDGGTLRRGVGLITNGPAEVQRAKIALLGLDDLVDFSLVSGELGVSKPDPRIFAEALRRGGTEPDAAVHVGDSAEYDVTGARAAGIRSIWLNRVGVAWTFGPPPDRTVGNLGQVPQLVASEGSGCRYPDFG